ncbi:MAG: carboxylesterase family protein [Lewinellaceae bacterium]|nr:carboxylesterase family protein [Saprospiraceae bacterium]MCB9339315.1 carboxylesterase family protein [Lewinellaceae bacterium]
MNRQTALSFSFLLSILLIANSAVSQITTPPVPTRNGLVTGTFNKNGDIQIFRGIPFAAPPVGDLRWKAPEPAANWDGVLACDKFPASAMQPPPVPFFVWSKEFMAPMEPLSEDCLYLNIWAPKMEGDQKLPVIVWIHGGGFVSGAGACPIYDGEGMAKKGVVFVSINYRLGIFGFLAHPELSAESGHNASGNYAFLDQIAALQWVKDNISNFGGDPERVTIAGQSAGAFSVNALMASPVANGLFQRAIAESGGMFSNERLKPLRKAELEGMQLMQKLNANSIADLRKLPADSLLKAATVNAPVLDGYVLPEDIYSIFLKGQQNDVPLLVGFNRDEGFVFGETKTAEQYKADAAQKYGKLAGKFLEAFPANDDAEAKQSQKNLGRDQLFAWQVRTWAGLQSQKGQHPAWLYRFDRVPPGRPDLAEHGAFHSAEIAYALNALPMWDRPWEPFDKRLSDMMSDYWVNFAATGNPNGEDLPTWSPMQASKTNAFVFGEKMGMQQDLLQQEFEFLDEWRAANVVDLADYQKEWFVLEGDTLPYRILFPEGYDRTKKYPLVLFLHGAGERGSDNEKQLVHGASLFLKPENKQEFPCIVLVPQCPADSYWSCASIDRTHYPIDVTFDYSAPMTKGLTLADALLHQVLETEAVDKSRVYITGLSMGGMGTFELVWREPDLFAAAAPICGGGDAKAYTDKLPKVPLRIFHGAADGVVNVEESRNMYAALKARGAEVNYTEYPGVNHNSWDYAFVEGDFLGWLFSKGKEGVK